LSKPSRTLVGIKIRLSRTDHCHDDVVIIGSGNAMSCATCGAYRGTLGPETVNIIHETRARFGAPEIITLRNPSIAAGDGAEGQ
jgi:hypothetical protein